MVRIRAESMRGLAARISPVRGSMYEAAAYRESTMVAIHPEDKVVADIHGIHVRA